MDFRVAVVSPSGDTVVPLDVDPVDWVVTPFAVMVFWLLVSTETAGAGMTGAVVDWVVVVLEEEDWAKAAPDINVTAIVATSKDLIMSISPGKLV